MFINEIALVRRRREWKFNRWNSHWDESAKMGHFTSFYQRIMDKVCLEVEMYPKSVVSSIVKLVGGFKHEFYCPFHIWDVTLPIDELTFFKMVKTTNQKMMMKHQQLCTLF